MSLRQLLIALATSASAWAGQAAAEITLSAPTATPNLGKMVQTSGSTRFSIAADGTVTRVSGTGVRLSNASVTTPTVTLTCGLLNLASLCAVRFVRVTVTPVTGSGSVTVNQLRVSNLFGASYYNFTAPAPGSTVTFVLNPVNLLPITFRVSMDVTVAPGATGDQTFGYSVAAEFVP